MADCVVGGVRATGLQRAGDMDFVPSGTDGCWDDDADCQILRLTLQTSLLARVADDLGRSATLDLIPQLRLRDARLETIVCAIRADLEAAVPADPLYVDLLTDALAVRLIEVAAHRPIPSTARGLPKQRLARLIEFIEADLGHKHHLAELADVAGVSVTVLKALFRNSTGMSVHQYVIRRRIEYARTLLATTTTPASEIALAAGFAHQSHMAATMRRVLGLTPSEIARP